MSSSHNQDVPHPAVPPPDPALLERGHAMTATIRQLEGDLSRWADELTADRTERDDALTHANAALLGLDQARTAIATYALIVAQAYGAQR